MQKQLRLISAAALLAVAAGGAQAQSSVSISGKLQLSIARGNDGTSPLYGGGAFDGWTVNSESSNLNFAGNEDLGGGTYAAFHLQHFFMADTGNQANFSKDAFWDGRSILRLGNNNIGEVYLGLDYVPLAFTGLGVDPWGWDGTAMQIGILQWANYLTTNGIRTSNTLGLKSASFGGGFVGQLAVGAGEGVVGRGLGASLTYANGPLWASAAYDEHANLGTSEKDHLLMLGAAYDFGAVRPMVQYSRSSVAGVAYNSTSVGLTAPVGVGSVKAAVARLNDADTAASGKQSLVKFSLGYEHPLSKRTAVFAGFASSKQSGLTRTTAGEVGLRHTF